MAKKTASKKLFSDDYPDLSDSVSEVDAEDMAKILKGADDIDNELFGFSNQSPQKSKKPTQVGSFGKDKEKPKKKQFGEFDDSDPLGDISLSDDDFYGTGTNKGKLSTSVDFTKSDTPVNSAPSVIPTTAKIKTDPITTPSTTDSVLDKNTKSKLIKDLFGLDNDLEENQLQALTTSTPIVENKKSDWLGIKESPTKPSDNKSDINKVNDGSLQLSSSIKKTDDFTTVKQPDRLNTSSNREEDTVVKKDAKFNVDFRNTNKGPSQGSNNDDVFDLLDDVGSKKTVKDEKTNKQSSLGLKSLKSDADKKKELADELFGSSKSSKVNQKSSQNVPAKDRADSFDKTVDPLAAGESQGLGQYKPSSGSARRPGFGRRRDSVPPQAMTGSPIKDVNVDDPPSWLFGNSQTDVQQSNSFSKRKTQLKQNSNLTSVPSTGADGTNIGGQNNQSSSLPSWLGGTQNEKAPINKETVIVTSKEKPDLKDEKIMVEIENNVHTEKPQKKGNVEKDEVPKEKDSLMIEVLNASSTLNEQNLTVMKQTENHLLSVVQMKQQQDMINDLCNRQKQMLDLQRKQMEQLVKQQINKQLRIDQQMKTQQEKINKLVQNLITEVQRPVPEDLGSITMNNVNIVNPLSIHGISNSVPNEGDNYEDDEDDILISKEPSRKKHHHYHDDNVVTDLEVSVQKLKVENASLEQRIESMEFRHAEEIKNMEKFHKYELMHLEAREERLKEALNELQKDYEARIVRLQENEFKLIEQHNMRIENLQKERLADLRQVGEFHRLAMEQVATVGKMLFEDTRIVESRRAIKHDQPLDESQLSSRELALIKKEKEIEGLKDNIQKQQLSLTAEREQFEEEMEQEKRLHEEKLRQLKREQSALKMKEEELIREQEREKELLKVQKKQVEELRDRALNEQAKAVEERLQVTALQARLKVLAELQGGEDISSISSFDLIQARAEVEGATAAAKEAKQKAEEEKQKLRQKQLLLEKEQWRLQEWEHEIIIKTQHVEELIKVSEGKREEGIKALEEAKTLERNVHVQNKNIQSQINDLNIREEKLIKEKLELAKDKAILDRRRTQLETVLPPLSPSENFTLGITNKNFVDPKKLIMKLKAEKEFDTLNVIT